MQTTKTICKATGKLNKYTKAKTKTNIQQQTYTKTKINKDTEYVPIIYKSHKTKAEATIHDKRFV